jgi:hypothetical protein
MLRVNARASFGPKKEVRQAVWTGLKTRVLVTLLARTQRMKKATLIRDSDAKPRSAIAGNVGASAL